MTDYETREYDVVVVGAGGAGLRAAIEAHEQGARTAIVCKSLLGKAHTVMAEGGIAAAMGNVYSDDNWKVHFRDTMRGGKFLNNWRMAQLHAQEAPERVQELEEWGALFDRTPEGLISQRDFGGHKYARLAHVGDRTGLEMIRTLQQRAVALGIDVLMECTVTRLLTGDGPEGPRITGAFAYWRETGRFVVLHAPAVVLATGGIGKSYKVTSNSWEYTGDGHALALQAGATLINMEFVQFHPTGMVWPPSVRGILVTESVRGDGGVLRNSEGKRFMFDYIPEVFASETADSEEEADRWYTDKKGARRPPELLPRDEVARAINSEVKAGRGSPHGGVFLDIASRRDADYIKKRLPSMYHQFSQLADVDITAEPMEVGPTCHYVMGGVEVDADTAASAVTGLYAAGEVAGGMHGSNRLGGNSLGDLLVFGKRAGAAAAAYAGKTGGLGTPDAGQVEEAAAVALAPFEREGENPYAVHQELQTTMNDLVGIIRVERELQEALTALEGIAERAPRRPRRGAPAVQPGLAPGARPGQHAPGLRVHRPGRAAADREPGRPHAGGPPRRRQGLGDEEPGLLAGGRPRLGARAAAAPDAPRARCPDGGLMPAYDLPLRVWRGDAAGGDFVSYTVPVEEGEVVLDALHRLQATQAPDLAVRWNCKAGKCGSCSAEVNGRPRLMCLTRLSIYEPGQELTITPLRAFPVLRDLVTDVSFNYEKASQVPAFKPPPKKDGEPYRMQQVDVERSQEFRKCIECFLCQDTCHVLRDHEENKPAFAGPRFFIRYAELEMHPLDTNDRRQLVQEQQGLGLCNITKCCTEVCPEGIHITDNGIIPLKERVVDRRYDPLRGLTRRLRGGTDDRNGRPGT